jgi:hypothetical protein
MDLLQAVEGDLRLKDSDFIKEFLLQDIYSGDKIDSLKILLLDLPKARLLLKNKGVDYDTYTDIDWYALTFARYLTLHRWVEILANSVNYTPESLKTILTASATVPQFFFDAFELLDMTRWSDEMISSYSKELAERHVLKGSLAYNSFWEDSSPRGGHNLLSIAERQGFERGAQKEKERMAARMLSSGFTREQIFLATELPWDLIGELASPLAPINCLARK